MGDEKVLMTLRGSVLLSNSWKQEMVITDQGVRGEVIEGLKRIKMTLPYDRIAQVNLIVGMFKADLEVVNKGGSGNLVVKALTKSDAEEAKRLIEERIQRASGGPAAASVADELRKLADLRAAGVLTEEEFETQKSRVLK